MPSFTGGNASFTPSLSNDNWTLDAATGTLGTVKFVGFGGQLVTPTGYQTRWVRPTTAGTGTKTALTIGAASPNYTSPGLTLTSTYGTAQPVLPANPAGNLLTQSWNAYGGLAAIWLAVGDGWIVFGGSGTAALSCRNVAGIDANGSSYTVVFDE